MNTKVVKELFTKINVPIHHRGYPYLVCIIALAMDQSDIFSLPLRTLYKKTAIRYKVSALQIENDIRSLLHAYFTEKNALLFTEAIGFPVYKRLTTKEFIFVVVDVMSSRLKTENSQ